jgi:alpha-ribazole phosphatase
MAKRLILVRHGRIAADHLGRLIGATDVALDPSGEAQVRTVADRVMRWRPESCYCSPMQRCRQTASLVAPELPPHFDADLREINFGHWEDRTFAEAAADQPAMVDRWAEFAADFAFPGGENVGDFVHRVRAAADRLRQVDANTVLAVTHGGVVRTMLCYLLDLEPRRYLAFDVPYAATAVVDLFDGRGVLAALTPPEAAEDANG